MASIKSLRHQILWLALGLLVSSSAWAGVNFVAAQACDAYSSFRHLKNPGAVHLQAGQSYTLLSGNKSSNPSWYQVRVEGPCPRERWVKATCGSVQMLHTPAANNNPVCEVANQADSYVFAVSWNPAFCANKPNLTECKIKDPAAYQASNFTLHGLWPDKTSCGIDYGFCGAVKTAPKDFCTYPPVPGLEGAVREELAIVMPSVAANSCLDRHEWYKHGTCQILNADQYYAEAIELTQQFNKSGMGAFMSAHVGQTVKLDEFLTAMDNNLGPGASKHAKLGCNKKGMLVDVYLNLPAQLKNADTALDLKALLAQAPEAKADKSCSGGFKVQPIGQFN